MKTNEILNAKQQQEKAHKNHISNTSENLNHSCTYCYPIVKSNLTEFNKFWDWIQIHFSALLVTRKSQEIFSQIIVERKNFNNQSIIKQKFDHLFQTITFGLTVNQTHFVEKAIEYINKRENLKSVDEKLKTRILKELEHFGSDIGSDYQSEEEIILEKSSDNSDKDSEKSINTNSNQSFSSQTLKSEEKFMSDQEDTFEDE